jgi:hypothetical protein
MGENLSEVEKFPLVEFSQNNRFPYSAGVVFFNLP